MLTALGYVIYGPPLISFTSHISPASLWLLNESCLSWLEVWVLTIPSTQRSALLQRSLSSSFYQFWPQLIFAIPSERPSPTP